MGRTGSVDRVSGEDSLFVQLEIMKVKFNGSELARAINKVWPALKDWSPIDAHENVLCRIAGDTFKLEAGGVSRFASARVKDAVSDGVGLFLLSGRVLRDIGKEHEGELEMTLNEAGVEIKGKRCSFILRFSPDPEIDPLGEIRWTYKLNPSPLKNLIAQVESATAGSQGSSALQSIFLRRISEDEDDDQSMIRAVATDGHRLHLVEIGEKEFTKEVSMTGDYERLDKGVLLDSGIAEFMRALPDDLEEIEVGFSETGWIVFQGDYLFALNMIEDVYPNYESVLAPLKDADCEISVSREELLNSTRAASIIDGKIMFKAEKDELVVSAKDDGQKEESSVNISARISGEKKKVSFKLSSTYIKDVLGVIPDAETVDLIIVEGEINIPIGLRHPERTFRSIMAQIR